MDDRARVLQSWKEISHYLGRGVRTVQRWERDFGLPVRRPAGHLKGSVLALQEEIDHWVTNCKAREADERRERATKSQATAHTAAHAEAKTKAVNATLTKLRVNAGTMQQHCDSLAASAQSLVSRLEQMTVLSQRLREQRVVNKTAVEQQNEPRAA